MNTWRTWTLWILAGALSLAFCVQVFPRLFPFYPQEWTADRKAAIALALRSFETLGEPVEDPYLVVELQQSAIRERELQGWVDEDNLEDLRRSGLAKEVLDWRVTVYETGAPNFQWVYRANISLDGRVLQLERREPLEEEHPNIEPDEARRRADAFLTRAGFDLASFEDVSLLRYDRANRTDLTLRYQERSSLLPDYLPFGVEVTFAGDVLTGYKTWLENPDRQNVQNSFSIAGLLGNFWILVPYLIFPFVAYFFMRRYHAGEIGVKRANQVFALVFLCGLLLMIQVARPSTEGTSFGVLSRAQTTFAWGFQLLILWFSAVGLVAALSWSVGEARCRENWGQKLASFDALFKRRWNNSTVAQAALRGAMAAMISTALLFALLLLLRRFGVETMISSLFGPWWHHAAWPGLTSIMFMVIIWLYVHLFAWLFLLPSAVRRFGTWIGGAVVALITAVLFWPPVPVQPSLWLPVPSLLNAAVLIFIFLRYDLLTSLLAGVGGSMIINALPFLLAEDPSLQWQGVLPFIAILLPCLLTLRHVQSNKEFVYRYEDVPPHVRRIAERERQRVELETARRIQSSILPDLPPQLAGIQLAHAYLPASEVGGDFYDVMALEDGRLAVAVGDVAGHGVSSGLIMSMAKSTLALQVTVDPDVRTVLHTLNRTVYQSARLRLLTTLCYALVDGKKREMLYGSAGHLAPYRITADGDVQAMRAASYPLGVRPSVEPEVRTVRLAAGDRLFLFSDGVIEARREGTDEMFGFERLEESLSRLADASPAALRDGVLEDLRRFTGETPREDDQTILVLQIP